MERKNLGVTIKNTVENNKVRRMARFRDTAAWVEMSKRRWRGHLARRGRPKWTYTNTMCDPRTGSRNLGRPQARWSDVFKMSSWQWTCEVQIQALWRNIQRRLHPEGEQVPFQDYPPSSNPVRYAWAAALTEFTAGSVKYLKIFQSWKNVCTLLWPN